MIVMKFGGTSLESAEAIHRLVEIVRGEIHRRPVVVVSAMGKTTNRLLAIAKAAIARDETYRTELGELRRYHWDVGIHVVQSDKLEELADLLEQEFNELNNLLLGLSILGELTPRSVDAISSYGERLSSRVIALALRSQSIPTTHVDSRQVIVTDAQHTQAAPHFPHTKKRLKMVAKAAQKQVVVMGGFIASTVEGVTTTLGRGGSDYTASIVGAAIGAEEIQIWTDVNGMMTTDPRLVPHAKQIKTISFHEAAEMAFFGAKVLHPATVRPAIERDIPVVVLNSRNPHSEGTRIVGRCEPSEDVVRAVACKRRVTMVNIHSATMFMTHGFLRRVFEIFDRHQTSIDIVTTSEVNVSLTLDEATDLEPICRELREFADVEVESNMAMLSVVGEGIGEQAGIAARIFKALEGTNVRMISQGASSLNVSVVIADSELESALKALHDEWFAEIEEKVFA